MSWLDKIKVGRQRQMQILKAIAAGKTHKVIAADLGISEKTVEYHCTKLYQRFNVFKVADVPAVVLTHFALSKGLIRNLYERDSTA